MRFLRVESTKISSLKNIGSSCSTAPPESPLDLIYQAADDDMNSIGVDSSPEASTEALLETSTKLTTESEISTTTVTTTSERESQDRF